MRRNMISRFRTKSIKNESSVTNYQGYIGSYLKMRESTIFFRIRLSIPHLSSVLIWDCFARIYGSKPMLGEPSGLLFFCSRSSAEDHALYFCSHLQSAYKVSTKTNELNVKANTNKLFIYTSNNHSEYNCAVNVQILSS